MIYGNVCLLCQVLSDNQVGAEGILAIAKAVTPKDDLKVLFMSGQSCNHGNGDNIKRVTGGDVNILCLLMIMNG